MKNKIVKCVALAMAGALLLSGCGNKKTEVVIPNGPETVAAENLEAGCFYVKSGEEYYKVPKGLNNFESDTDQKTIWFKDDDLLVPTIYSDDNLIYVADNELAAGFTWTRFTDDGYTVGIKDFALNDDGMVTLAVNQNSFYPGSSAYMTAFPEKDDAIFDADTTVILNDVNGTTVSAGQISRGGTIKGLTKKAGYTVDLFAGTKGIPLAANADVHAYSSFETYESSDQTLSGAGYAVIKTPEVLRSGFYSVNDSGLFRYVDNPRSEGIGNTDFNKPYYYKDTNGNTITLDDIEAEQAAENGESEFTEEIGDVYRFKMTFDNTQEDLTVKVEYSEPETVVDGNTVDMKNVLAPKAEITSPDGQTYQFTNSDRQDNLLECPISGVITSGDWVVTLAGMNDRTFNVSADVQSGRANSFIHNGTGTGTLDYYVESDLKDGYITVTWDNNSHAADLIIIAPNGDKYGKSINDADLLNESYGSQTIHVGNTGAGTYNINITGDNLGRVRVSYEDRAGEEIKRNDNTSEEYADGYKVEEEDGSENNEDLTETEESENE